MKLIDFKDLFNWIHCNSIELKHADNNSVLKKYDENEDTYAGYFFIADDKFDDWYLEDQYSPVELTRKIWCR